MFHINFNVTTSERKMSEQEGSHGRNSGRVLLVIEEKGVQRFMYVQISVVVDVSHLPKSVHEVTYSRPCGPTISASVSWSIFGTSEFGFPFSLKSASSNRILASRFSLELQT